MAWDNFDGLKVKFGDERADRNPKGANAVQATHHMTVSVDIVDGNHALTDVSSWDAYIPGGSYITKASLVVTEAFVGGTNITIGLAETDQSIIDADGIDAAIITSALVAGKAVACNGALVALAVTIGADDAVVYVTSSGTYTAGKADLVIEYISV